MTGLQLSSERVAAHFLHLKVVPGVRSPLVRLSLHFPVSSRRGMGRAELSFLRRRAQL